jgi:hypothetical protein
MEIQAKTNTDRKEKNRKEREREGQRERDKERGTKREVMLGVSENRDYCSA